MHHQLIRELVAEIRRLRADIDSINYQMEDMEYGYSNSLARANESARKAEYARREAEQQAESERYNRERLSDLTSQIEKASRYGETWKVERLQREARYYR